MARLERVDSTKVADYDDRVTEALIKLREEYRITVAVWNIRCHLIDLTLSETVPQYALFEDEDTLISPQFTVDLESYHDEEAAIAGCQEHHDSIYGSLLGLPDSRRLLRSNPKFGNSEK
jgi:hypothetical protein